MKFLEALAQGKTLLADGATGTMLQAMGLPVGDAPEQWTLRRPDAVRQLARWYAAAGSDLVYTNTFGASRVPLRRCGLEDQIAHLNQRAVSLVREGVTAAGETALVVGAMGPTGELLEPYGEFSADEARQSFAEQATLLAEAGVDAIVCETFTDLNEALSAVSAVRETTQLSVLDGC
jgi:5-methyltetrahydrofolate--homocysteine methyltransferase